MHTHECTDAVALAHQDQIVAEQVYDTSSMTAVGLEVNVCDSLAASLKSDPRQHQESHNIRDGIYTSGSMVCTEEESLCDLLHI
jgi:hypothetical protein